MRRILFFAGIMSFGLMGAYDLTTAKAMSIVQKTLASCQSKGYAVSVSVVSAEGRILAVLRDDTAGPHTISGSFKKAYTAASMKRPTTEILKRVEEGKMHMGLIHLDKNLIFAGGGVPIRAQDGKVIGAVGVGGAPGGDIDEACALDGLKGMRF